MRAMGVIIDLTHQNKPQVRLLHFLQRAILGAICTAIVSTHHTARCSAASSAELLDDRHIGLMLIKLLEQATGLRQGHMYDEYRHSDSNFALHRRW